ncbi:NTE family protein RssA [Pirellula sp. SH-Sr6A]|uniref:patatin-like phospholipase family protein n=1 Tax=Pirellula sp. SH-Sr6A TaxID=1632865 RepID=UPI00078DA8EC|nr:patatin-like phospholipase family protein [Pirellula sp. SH-Sr6A]AMV32468.1 NTE family protein RssA [Pirellula sp. SH-Sr6A]
MPGTAAEIEQMVGWLAKVRFCRGLDGNQLLELAPEFTLRSFAAGETVALADEPVTEFWIVVEGELESFLTDPRGRERLLGTVHQGETLGEVAILEQNLNRPTRFTARTNGTLLVAPAEALLRWVQTYPVLMQNLFSTLSERFKVVAGAASRSVPSPRLGIIVTSKRGFVLAGRLLTKLLQSGERIEVWSNHSDRWNETGCLPQAVSIKTIAQHDAPMLEPPPPQFDRRVIVWETDSRNGTDFQPLLGCDEILWFAEPTDAPNLEQMTASLTFLQGNASERLRLVWLLNSNSPIAPLLNRLRFKKRDVKVVVETSNGTPSRQETQGVDRLARVLRGISIGIALAGGGAKGMAHFGVLQVLEEAGVSFDVMSGTSAGAMAGILYASGMAPQDALQRFQRDLTPSKLFRCLPNWPNLYLVRQYRRKAWDGMLRKYLHDWELEQLSIPFHAITVDLVQARTVVRQEGDAVRAILESINLPVVSPPILRDGMALVDGGVLNNLPADVLAENGADFVVGVDVSSHVRPEFAGNRPDMPTTKMRNAGSIDTIFRIFESQAHNIGKMRNRAVDFWIKPNTSIFGLAEFYRTNEIAEAGKNAAQECIMELQQRLSELEKRLIAPSKSHG